MTEIKLNLSGLKCLFRYNGDFSVVEVRLSKGNWSGISFVHLPCGNILTVNDVINIIRHKIASN